MTDSNTPIVITFYTNDWLYEKYALEMKDRCDNVLGIECYIEEKPSFKSYVNNTKIKPGFILECLEKFQRPVIWCDADGYIEKIPPQMLDKNNLDTYDLIANPTVKSNATRLRIIHVGSFLLNYTPNMLKFVRQWHELCSDPTQIGKGDDSLFTECYNKNDDIKLLKLPEECFKVNRKKINHIGTPNSYFVHRLSHSDLKAKWKAGKINK